MLCSKYQRGCVNILPQPYIDVHVHSFVHMYFLTGITLNRSPSALLPRERAYSSLRGHMSAQIKPLYSYMSLQAVQPKTIVQWSVRWTMKLCCLKMTKQFFPKSKHEVEETVLKTTSEDANTEMTSWAFAVNFRYCWHTVCWKLWFCQQCVGTNNSV